MAEAAPPPSVPVSVSVAKIPKYGEWTTSILDVAEDPATAIIGYCLPCVLYGQIAERVHGGDMVNHCLKFYLYSCICACGLVTGPTRNSVRNAYNLPVAPEFLKDQGENADCITGTIPCVNCFALCQDAREVNLRNPSGPLNPQAFSWAPATNGAAAPAATTAPVQAEMGK